VADLPSFVTSALEPARAALAAGLCLAACVRAFDVLAGRAAALSRARCAGAGVLIGASAWAGAIVGPGLPAAARIDALGAAASLTIAVAGAALALAVFRRCKGALRVIGGGALLGASVAASRGVLLNSLGADVDFDDTLFCSGAALVSATGVLALAIFGLERDLRGRLAAALSLGAGLAASAALAGGSVQIHTPLGAGLPVIDLALIAGAATLVLLAVSCRAPRRPLSRPATRGAVWRGSLRPFPRRRPAGTASPRPRPARSAAGRAAGPGRRAQPAD
jgi:NO-binding membrane sensor protein with MHYT domain